MRPTLFSLLVWVVLTAACTSSAPELPEGPAPFSVRATSENLLVVYIEGGAFKTAATPSDVPEAARALVRVDDLGVLADSSSGPSFVWVTDLRSPGSDGTYPVRAMARAEFAAAAKASAATSSVVLYSASWCGACRSARQFLEGRGIAYIERDIEREAGAREEMMGKAKAAGIATSGIPILDVRGTIIAGFNQGAIERALHE